MSISDVTEHIRGDSCLSKSVPHLVLPLPTPVPRPAPLPLSLLLLLTGVICQCCYSTDSSKDCSSTTKFMKLVFHSCLIVSCLTSHEYGGIRENTGASVGAPPKKANREGGIREREREESAESGPCSLPPTLFLSRLKGIDYSVRSLVLYYLRFGANFGLSSCVGRGGTVWLLARERSSAKVWTRRM